jgi:hypothetical protein
MKSQGVVSNTMRWVALFSCAGWLGGCDSYKLTTSQYGHGFYRCYYQNTRTGVFYKGIDDNEKDATRAAQRACGKAAVDENDMARCLFAECVFK